MSIKAEAEAAGISRQTIYHRRVKAAKERRNEAAQIFGRIWAIAEASADNQLSPELHSHYMQQPCIHMAKVLQLAPNVDNDRMSSVMSDLTPDDLQIGPLNDLEQNVLILGEFHERARSNALAKEGL